MRESAIHRIFAAAALCLQLLAAQAPPPSRGDDQWRALEFLEGTWEAKTRSSASGIDASGTYTFRKELNGHILSRSSNAAGCAGPAGTDCSHRDLLYVYQEASGQPLKAIYFDNEGHVIHYDVSAPKANSAVFLSGPTAAGPQFRLVYELKGAVMEGRFQMRMPGKPDWTSYLEWSGRKQ